MSNYFKVLFCAGLLSLFSAFPLAAQVGNGLEFNAPFSFYVGQAKMPAGSYTLTEPTYLDFRVIMVRSNDGRYKAATGVIGAQSSQPPRHTMVVFEQYGDNLYLDNILLADDTAGVRVLPTKSEKKAEKNASIVQQRSVTVSGE